jgi:hypothetical protein
MADSSQIRCFFFLKNVPTVGSGMEMELSLPEEITGSKTTMIHCQGKVAQVEKESVPGRVEVRCTVENYRLLPLSADADHAKETKA